MEPLPTSVHIILQFISRQNGSKFSNRKLFSFGFAEDSYVGNGSMLIFQYLQLFKWLNRLCP